jgi:putative membrane protein
MSSEFDQPETTPVQQPVNQPVSEDTPPASASPPEVDVDEMLRLHPTSLLFDLISHGKSFLLPVLLGLFGAANGDLTLVIVSGVAFVPAVAFSIFRYVTYRYLIKENHLIVRQGLIFRNVRTVPVKRIQNIDFVQSPLHRILKVAEVKVETASGTKPEATLRVLSMVEMENLRNAVFGSQKQVDVSSVVSSIDSDGSSDAGGVLSPTSMALPETGTNTISQSSGDELLRIPVSALVRAGLASNRGMLIVGILLGALVQFSDDYRPKAMVAWIREIMPTDATTTSIILAIVGSMFVALVLLRLLGIGWFLLRFFGYKLVRYGSDLRISCGLFTKVSATVPRQRIQFISIHENLIMRWWGLASIRIETAGGAGNGGENATETVSKRWFVPVIRKELVPQLLAEVRPGLKWDESSLEFKPVHPRTTTRLCRLSVIQSLIIAGLGLFVSLQWGWIGGAVVLPLFILWAIKKGKAMRYARTDNGVIYKSGVFTKKTSMTFFEKIQTLAVNQSPFDRRWKMATLFVDTAAAGPAEHTISVKYLEEDFAKEEMQRLRVKTGAEQPVFG